MDTKTKETAMRQLLNQLREERSKLPLPAEWDRCYQAVEMMIESTYTPLEKEQITYAHLTGLIHPLEMEASKQAEQYYQETYGK